MSHLETQPIELDRLKTYSLHDRASKVLHTQIGRPLEPGGTVNDLLDGLPTILAGNDLRSVRDHICRAHGEGGGVAVALGGHVIKTGCAPYLIDLMERGVVTAVSMNGAAAIHDLELALAGKTSEDVGAMLPEGRFGMARETAEVFAAACEIGARRQVGLGRGVGEHLAGLACPHGEVSVVLAAWRRGIPCTVHVAVGTDIVHMHPCLSGAALGEASLIDFRILCGVVAGLSRGVWMNLGSAVVLPEVFLKCVSVARNLGFDLDELVTVNLDMLQQYRGRVNVVSRPSAQGLSLVGHHEIMIPLLHAGIVGKLKVKGQKAKVTKRAVRSASLG